MENKNFSFGKHILIPFASGVIGASCVLGINYGVQKAGLFLNNNHSEITNETPSSVTSTLSTVSLKNYSDTSISVAEKILPSVVGIEVEYSVSSIFYRGESTATAEGSGVIISEDGYILTNNHVVDTSTSSSFYNVSEANKVIIHLYNDETDYEGTIIGTDELTDLAVIKIDKEGLTAASLGDSDSSKVGEFVMAVGNPLSLQSSISAGIISAVNRKVTNDGKTFTLIQTDTAINSGNSGGALVNANGEVIGINTLKMSGSGIEGIGFAIPINSAKPIYEQLIQYNKVKRPYIGITGRDINEQTAKAYSLVEGVYITTISEFSPAEKAGLKLGDVITEIDGKQVKTLNELNEIKNTYTIGTTVSLKVYRSGEYKDISLTLEEQ